MDAPTTPMDLPAPPPEHPPEHPPGAHPSAHPNPRPPPPHPHAGWRDASTSACWEAWRAGWPTRSGIDVVIVRLGFVVSAFFGGLGVIAYVLGWVLLPAAPGASPATSAAG